MNNKIFGKVIAEKRAKCSSKKPRYALRKLSIGVVSCLIGYAFLIGGNVSFAETDTNSSAQFVEFIEKAEKEETTKEIAKETPEKNTEKTPENSEDISDEKIDTKKVESVNKKELMATENVKEMEENPVHKEQFTVVFDANGGKFDTENNTLTVNAGENATFSETPTLAGKIFVGWANSPDATEAQEDILQNITANKTVYAVWKVDDKEISKTQDKPIVTSTKPEDVSDYLSLNFNASSFMENDGTLHYGKILDKDNNEVENNNEIEGIKTRTYWVLKSATWKDVKDFTDKDGKSVYQNLTVNSEDEKHPFLGWSDNSSLDNIVDLTSKFEDKSVIGESTKDGLNFYAKYKANDYVYYGKTDNSKPAYDSDGYKLDLKNDYKKVTFKIKDEKIGKVYLKEKQKKLIGKDVATKDDGSIKLEDATIGDKEITVFVERQKAKDIAFKDIVVETDSIDKDHEYWYWYRNDYDSKEYTTQYFKVFNKLKNTDIMPDEVNFSPVFVTNGEDLTDVSIRPNPPKMHVAGKNYTEERFYIVLIEKEKQIEDILRKDGKSYFNKVYAIFKGKTVDSIFKKNPPANPGPVLPTLKEEFKDTYANPNWYDGRSNRHTEFNNIDMSKIVVYESLIFTARSTNIPVINEIDEASDYIEGKAESNGNVVIFVDGTRIGQVKVDRFKKWKIKVKGRCVLKAGSVIEVKYLDYKKTLPASTKFIVKKAKDNVKFTPVYEGAVVNPGNTAVINAPKFINDLNKSEAVDEPIAKKYELVDCATEGIVIDEKTGEITYNTKESDADKTIDLKVKITYLDDTTENVSTTIKINSLDEIINRKENPDAQTPEGYVRVTMKAGEGVQLKQEKIYDIKKGLSLAAEYYPEVEINHENKNDYKSPINWTVNPGEKIENSVEIIANATKTQASVNEPIGKEIKILEGESVEAKDLVANSDAMPTDTTFEFKEKPDTKTAGKFDETIIVKYSDGSIDKVQSKIIVQKQAAIITPIPTVEAIDEIVGFGETYDLTDNITNLPTGAKVTDITEKDAINTNKSGKYIGKVKVTFENGATRVMTVKVVVNKSLAETNNPVGKEIKILEEENVEASELIENKQDLPTDTTFEFKEKPDTKTAGKLNTTIIVKYSDESVDEVQSKIIVQKQAAVITPIPTVEAIDEIVDYGKTYNLTDNIKDLPSGAKVTDITDEGTINTNKSGNYIRKVKVTFENGEARIVNVKVVVNKSLAETNEPTGKEIKILEGESVEAKDLVENSDAMPENTTFEFKEKPDTKTAGKKDTTIIVKYSDGSIDDVQSKIIVQKQAAVITPIPTVEAIDEIVEFGKTYDLTDNIKNLPSGAKVTDITEKDAINTNKSGNYIRKVKVTFENGEARIVNVKVVVNKSLAETNNPVGKEIKILEGENVEAKDLVANSDAMPTDTTFEFKEKPGTKTAGKIDTTIIVKYSDGSIDEVQSKIIVQKQAAVITPIPTVEAIDEIVEFGKTYDLTDNITNLPNGATVTDITEKDSINTSKSGNYIGKVKVTFENGEARIVNVKVVVNKSLAEKFVPDVKTIEVEAGELSAKKLESAIANLPQDSKLEIKSSAEGKAVVTIKFADGSEKEVEISYKTKENKTEVNPETNDNDENNEEDNKPEKEENPDKEQDKKPEEDEDNKPEKEEDNKPEKEEKPGEDLVENPEDNENIKKPEEKIETKPEVNHQTSKTSEKSSTKPGKTTENIVKPNAEGIQIRFEKTNVKTGDKVLLKPIFTDKSGKVIDVPMDVEFSLEDNSPSGVKINSKTGELRFDTTGYKAGDRIELIVVTKFRGKTTQTFALFADDSVVKLPEKPTSTTTPDFVIKTKVVINIVESENGKSKNISENNSEFTKSNLKSQLPKAGMEVEIANLTLAIVSCATGAYFTRKKK